ncbi:MAG: hypothetical protein JNM64_20355 [Chloroflexia bacterium]|nr:hypothetical protein [Chloroflexia bacterium]
MTSCRVRITARHLPAVRTALARVVGAPLPVRAVMGQPPGCARAPA